MMATATRIKLNTPRTAAEQATFDVIVMDAPQVTADTTATDLRGMSGTFVADELTAAPLTLTAAKLAALLIAEFRMDAGDALAAVGDVQEGEGELVLVHM